MALTLGAISAGNPNALAAFGPDPWKIKMLTADTGVFTEKGGTIMFYNSSDGIMVVDSQFPEQAGHLIAELRKRIKKPFSTLINTHHHGDHSAGNIAFRGLVYQVIAHENSLANQRRVAAAQGKEDEQVFPDLVFTDTMSRNLGREKITLHYFGPAHTNGDAIIHLENANIAHMGDLINNRRYPYIDRSAGASIRNWINVLDKTTSVFDQKTTFVFGHAAEAWPVYGKAEDIKVMKDYFEKLLKFTETALGSGKSKEEFLKEKSIPGVTQWSGTGIERSLTAAYEELTQKN